eukprot:CAMPEP_0197590440 /NCGR_PEP_ID=MMETSP1326-20131121/11032_1 /TAXON_ID=1155430 /ORGANISM="Genus nov. species nov., Strain RCC2288" /LENGTH=224 /DNA_ID=CAMNT_0043155471 /DNA_START=12 /DNA_END=687 /DNA_ORIENTATION=-
MPPHRKKPPRQSYSTEYTRIVEQYAPLLRGGPASSASPRPNPPQLPASSQPAGLLRRVSHLTLTRVTGQVTTQLVLAAVAWWRRSAEKGKGVGTVEGAADASETQCATKKQKKKTGWGAPSLDLASRFPQALLKYFGAGRATFGNFSAFGIAPMLDGDGFLPPVGVRAGTGSVDATMRAAARTTRREVMAGRRGDVAGARATFFFRKDHQRLPRRSSLCDGDDL